MKQHEIEVYKEIRKSIKAGSFADVVELIGNDTSRLRMETPFGTWLHVASAHGKLDIVRWLVSQGLDVNSIGGMGDRRPIDEAAAAGHLEVVRFLIDSGAVLDVENSTRNPLFSTIVGGLSESHNAVAVLLVEAGIDTTKRYPNLNNMDALEYANEWGRGDIVTLLKSKQQP